MSALNLYHCPPICIALDDPQRDGSCIGAALTRQSASVIVISTTAGPFYLTNDPDACPQSIDRPPFEHSWCGPLHYKSQNSVP